GAVIVSTDGTEKRLAPVGQVIVAVGVRPRQELKELLVRQNIRHFVVGDAQEARRIIEATTEGAKAAWRI
ncbi:MAG: NADH:flavin oxidoreductase, partial [Desulfobacterales bacterium]|nr:NADH:flavin oxidoreductase [Desulfobacterales bacterium]